MKRHFLLLTFILMLCLCCQALAAGVVRATGSVNLRKGPGLSYGKVASIKKGRELTYLDETSTDDRGIDWYRVEYKGQAVWISSRYSKLKSVEPTPEPTPTPEPQPAVTLPPRIDPTALPSFGAEDMVELSDFYLGSLSGAAMALGLSNHGQDSLSELSNFYSNDALLIAGNDTLEHILVTGPGYSVFGVYVGMDISAAKSTLAFAGLAQSGSLMGVYFQHLAGPNSRVNVDGYDSGISLMTDANGTVTEISWSTYSG